MSAYGRVGFDAWEDDEERKTRLGEILGFLSFFSYVFFFINFVSVMMFSFVFLWFSPFFFHITSIIL